MALDHADIARRFEPVLYFHLEEKFFPSDAKRYLERCALWNAPHDANASWGSGPGGSGPGFPRRPLIQRRHISAMPTEKALEETGTFLGSEQMLAPKFPFLFMAEEGFLDLAGWRDADGVTQTSQNRFANIDEIERRYNHPSS